MKRYKAVFSDKIGRYADRDFLTSTDSINIWFDWVERFTYTIPQIVKNIAYRQGRRDPSYILDMSRKMERIDPNTDGSSAVSEDYKKAQDMNLATIDINSTSLEKLDDMASYLEANGIKFAVIVTPHRSDVKAGYGDEYDAIDDYFENIVTKRGGQYFNIDNDPALREQLPDDMFMDSEHIVDEGNDLVSKKIAELLR